MSTDRVTLPLVIFAIDAGDPDLIERWVREGYLPTLGWIMERGCWGRTAGPELISELGAWLSLFSGVSRIEHGYYDFRQLKPGTYELQLFTAREANARPFWSRLSRQDKRVAIIDVPDIYPVPALNGVQLSNWATHYSFFPTTAEPASLLSDVRRVFGPQIKIHEHKAGQRVYRQLMARVDKKGVLCRHLVASDRFALIVAAFSDAHTASHAFWKCRSEARKGETPSAATPGGVANPIRDVYQAIDRQMGLLLAALPSPADVWVVSSAGLQDQSPTTGLVEEFARKLGYQAPAAPGAPSLRPMDMIRRVVPDSWRVALSQHFPRATREHLLAAQFRDGTNWRATTAFVVPSFYTGFLRVNLAGREPEGIVEPGAGYDELLDRLETDLRLLLDPETGDPAVRHVARTQELFGDGPPVSLPDLFVEWDPAFMPRVVHPKAVLEQRPAVIWDSGHSRHGFVAAAGPSIAGRGRLGDVSPLDLAPTFLSLMGEPVGDEMTGKVLGAIMHGRSSSA